MNPPAESAARTEPTAPTAPAETKEATEPVRRRPGRRPVGLVLAGGAVLVAGTVAVVVATRDRTAPPAFRPLPTTPIVRTDLIERQRVDGTLGYADAFPILGHGGTLTWLPHVGTVIERGRAVFAADNVDVPLLYGDTPLWRTIGPGDHGPDVRLLQRNLAALGHDVRADGRMGTATARAVERWRRGFRHPPAARPWGTVRPGDVVVAPGPIRVTDITGVKSGPATGTVLRAAGTRRVVTVKLPVGQRRLAKAGARVEVELPGGVRVPGRIAEVGTVASAPEPAAGGGGQGLQPAAQPGQAVENATVDVTVTLGRRQDATQLDGAPVVVGFTSAAHRGVLAVPVRSLLALGPDSYAVRVVAGADRRVVPVRLGAFANGDVGVSAPGLSPGLQVEVPAS